MNAVRFGMEYELERTSSSYRPRGWLAESDGTLRDSGVEFLFRQPATLEESKTLVRSLIQSIGDNFNITHRCSTHIHVDTTSLKGYQRVALLLGLIIHDEWFFQYGQGRQYNNYCCPVLKSPAALVSINAAVRAHDWNSDGTWRELPVSRQISTLSEQDTKYMSVNTMPLSRLGTIELRHFSPLMNEIDVDTVLNKLAALYDVASSVGVSGKNTAGEVWTGYDKELEQEILWTQGIYSLHNQMVGN